MNYFNNKNTPNTPRERLFKSTKRKFFTWKTSDKIMTDNTTQKTSNPSIKCEKPEKKRVRFSQNSYMFPDTLASQSRRRGILMRTYKSSSSMHKTTPSHFVKPLSSWNLHSLPNPYLPLNQVLIIQNQQIA